MRTVTKISVAPVKSMALHHPAEARLERWGVAGNRRFFLIDERGRLLDAVKHGPLVRIRADYDAATEWLSLQLPDGTLAEGRADVLGDAVQTDFFRRTVHGRVAEGPWEEALSRYVGAPVRLVRPDNQGDANDVWPVSILSTASAEELSRRSGRSEPRDTRRFRMLIEVAGCEPHEEDTWIGRGVRLGEALLRVPGAIPRCVVTTQDPSTGAHDFSTLSEIKRYRGASEDGVFFGVYGDVLEPGVVRLGDLVEPIAD